MNKEESPASFEELTSRVLPEKLSLLNQVIKLPINADIFTGFKSATKPLLAKLNINEDFSGCYVFIDGDKPIYVGISRKVVNRVVQHLNHVSHFTANLVYKMATEDSKHTMKRKEAMNDDSFKKLFKAYQDRLRKMSVAYINIHDDMEMYLFEVYASIKLDTKKWNSFRTH